MNSNLICVCVCVCFFLAATVDVKRNIYDLSINKYGSQIAIVENQGDFQSGQESAVRIYSVGRKKNMEDEVDEEDDDMAVSDDSTISENDSLGKYVCLHFSVSFFRKLILMKLQAM